ncbi:MAG: sialate O-acetylesterase [Candidatus Anammoximicrobium sp.]|nr:sialate O-acetylesterase [Candidatus Anammoximicrobium sp.]
MRCGLTLFLAWWGLLTCLAAEPLPAGDLTVAYPVPYVLYQRTTADSGPLEIRGTYRPAGAGGAVEARFNGGPWQVVDAKPHNGSFSGTITASTGQGTLEVRAGGGAGPEVRVEPVSVGDLFVIAGQSNADGRGDEHVLLNPANRYVGVKFRHHAWSRGDDPSANDGDYGSPWPMVLNDLIPAQHVPMGFLAAAVGSTVVQEWRKGGRLYERMFQMVTKATGGSRRIKAVLYYQGENDITHYHTHSALGDYDRYKRDLTAAVGDFQRDFGAPVLVGQITNLLSDRAKNDAIRRAQQEVWSEHPAALPGAVTYDIRPSDGVHYRTEPNLRAFARRWTLAIHASLYGKTGCANPQLQHALAVDDRSVRLVFDQPLAIAAWDGASGNKALGFRLVDGEQTWTDADVLQTTVQGKEVTVTFGRPFPATALLWYGSGADGQGRPTLRGADNHAPVRMVFSRRLTTTPRSRP